MLHFNFNGKTYVEGTPIIGPDNRGLRYGDGLFETIKYQQGQFILLDEHFSRLWKGMQQLHFQLPKLLTPDALQQEALQLIRKNKQTAARVRITIVRGNGGLYDAQHHNPQFVIQSWPLSPDNATLNENGLQACIYPDAKKSLDNFSNLKHNNFLPYLMGALYAKQQQCNDAIILNSHGRIADSSIANIFLVRNDSISTPALSEGCVAGVMRKFLIQQLNGAGYHISESAITTDAMMEADEIFLTNSIYNMRWVAGIGNKKYTNTVTRKIYDLIQRTNPDTFC